MRFMHFAAAGLLSFAAVSALAQAPAVMDPVTGARPGHELGVGESLPRSDKVSNIVPSDTRSNIAPTLPPSAVGENAAIHDYLRAARAALGADLTGQAQQSLEMAETRALDRAVPHGQTSVPNDSQLVTRIRAARHALGRGDSVQAVQFIELALSN